MNNKVLTIALLVFALIFVVLLAILMGTITSKTNAANTKLVDTLDMTEGMELSNYESATMKGNAVINAINNGKSLGGKNKIFVYVDTKGTGTTPHGEVYGYAVEGSGTGGESFGNMSYNDGSDPDTDFTKSIKTSTNYRTYSAPVSTDQAYINESAEFDSHLVRNVNDVTVGIYFVQK